MKDIPVVVRNDNVLQSLLGFVPLLDQQIKVNTRVDERTSVGS